MTPASAAPAAGLKIVLVNGFPGTGKTTLGRRIANHFGWPFISKDAFKEVIFDTLGWSDKQWSLRVSASTHRIMDYIIKEQLRARHSTVVESNFKPDLDSARFEWFRIEHGATLVQVLCWARGDALFERYVARLSADRHPGHVESDSLDVAREALAPGRAERMDICGETIEVDTTDFARVDDAALFQRIELAAPCPHGATGA